jgi:hypothetical protein
MMINWSKLGGLLCLFLWLGSGLYAQDQNDPDQSGQSESIDREAEIRLLIQFLELNLNTLGDPEVSTAEKDIIIEESFRKTFADELVQIEDDLDTAREVPLRKNVSAYLKDVVFFFKEAEFDYQIEEITSGIRDDGLPFYLVKGRRSLEAIGLRGDSIFDDIERFVELNVRDENLVVASIYTKPLGQIQERRLWWAQVPEMWKQRLGGSAELLPQLPLSSVRYWNSALLFTDQDTLLLAGFSKSHLLLDSTQILWQEDSLSINPDDSLVLSAKDLDLFLEGLLAQKSLNLSSFESNDLKPLSRFTELENLNLDYSDVDDLAPLRALSNLKKISLNHTEVRDLSPLRYARGLEEIYARNSRIDSKLPMFRELRILELQMAPLDSQWVLPNLPKLEVLKIHSAELQGFKGWPKLKSLKELQVSDLHWYKLEELPLAPNLEILDISSTKVRKLDSLIRYPGLRVLNADACPVRSLKAIESLESLQTIYCDQSGVDQKEAERFSEVRPKPLLVYDSKSLLSWWRGLNNDWRQALIDHAQLDINPGQSPSREALHEIASIEALDLRIYSGIKDLYPLGVLRQLQHLNIRGLAIQDIAALEKLDEIRTVDLSDNEIQHVAALASLNRLENLQIENCPVIDLDSLLENQRLRLIRADGLGLAEEDVKKFWKKRPDILLVWRSPENRARWEKWDTNWRAVFQHQLQFEGEPRAEDLENIMRLKKLQIKENQVENLRPLADLVELRELRFPDNKVNSLWPLHRLKKLEVLDFSRNPVNELEALEGMEKLREVYANRTAIDELESLRLALGLEILECSSTPIKSISSLVLLTDLRILHIDGTRVRSLKPLDEHRKLEKLVLFNTLVSEGKIQKFQASHPNCEVEYY